MQVLRLTAMGRINHPDQERFCEAVSKVLESKTVAEEPRESMAEWLEQTKSLNEPTPAPKKRTKKAD